MMMTTRDMMTSSSHTTDKPPDYDDVNTWYDDIILWHDDTMISVYTSDSYLVTHWWQQHRCCFLSNASTWQLQSLFHLWRTLFRTSYDSLCLELHVLYIFSHSNWSSVTYIVGHSRHGGLPSIIFSGEVDNLMLLSDCVKNVVGFLFIIICKTTWSKVLVIQLKYWNV